MLVLTVIIFTLACCSSDFTRFADDTDTRSVPATKIDLKKVTEEYRKMPYSVYDKKHNVVMSDDLAPIPLSDSDKPEMQKIAMQVHDTHHAPPALIQKKMVLSSFGESHPKKVTEKQTYLVQTGDTLFAIASNYDINVKELKYKNGLDGDLIRVGQMLIIPGSSTQLASLAVEKSFQEKRGDTSTIRSNSEIITDQPRRDDDVLLTKGNAISTTDIAQKAENIASSAPQTSILSKMVWPVRGRIVSNYGQHEGIVSNNGMDIMVPENTSVKAAESGTVIYASDGLKEFGKTILIRHTDNIVTVYGHNSRILVQRGQQIQQGDEIAKSGTSGNAPTPRLHFEVRKNSAPVNPVEYLEN
ncbi:MAG: Peptidase M23 family protein [Candidatus Tokpelaia sp. JSC188]|nr:MAG: Peptidase M23 family protein [Candidatus Tokpelaia sp. JSC188]